MEQSFQLHELPLILFTLITQMAFGLSFVTSIAMIMAKTGLNKSFNITESGSAHSWVVRKIHLFSFVFGLVGIILSTTHLGDSFHGFYILTRIFDTALPREVIFCAGFTGISFLIFVFLNRIPATKILLVINPIVALIGLIFMSSFYGQMAGTNPGWNFGYTFMRFLSASCLLGGLFSAVLAIMHRYSGGNTTLTMKSIYATSFGVIIIGSLLSLIYQPNFEFYLANVSNNIATSIFSYSTQLSWSNCLIAIGVFIAMIDFAINFIRLSSKQKPSILTLIAFILIIVGLFISRDIFYALKNTQVM